jgi:hypothetical protein
MMTHTPLGIVLTTTRRQQELQTADFSGSYEIAFYNPPLQTEHKASQIELHPPSKPNISALCSHQLDRTLQSVIFAEVGKVHSPG